MKKLALSLLFFSVMASAADLQFIAIHNNDPANKSNKAAIFSLIPSGGADLLGSFDLTMSDNTGRTVATYIPTAPKDAGNTGTGNLLWKYQLSGFSGVPFRGSYCPAPGCPSGYLNPLSVSGSEMLIRYYPFSGYFGRVGLTLSSALFNYLTGMGAGEIMNVTTSPHKTDASSPALSEQYNSLQKLGDYRLDNSATFEFSVDPITGKIILRNSVTGQRCTEYQYLALKGQLCEVMQYSYQGSSIEITNVLSLTVSKKNPLLGEFQGKGLDISLTFDEINWYNLSNASILPPHEFANRFLQQPIKSGGQASLKMFFPDGFIHQVALSGKGSYLTDILTLCLNKPITNITADFCFNLGNGMTIKPIDPSIEIKPKYPDYELDPTGYGASGKGKIGDSKPISIPYDIIASSSDDPAIKVSAKVEGPGKPLNGQHYCLFKGIGNPAIEVPVPGNVKIGLSGKIKEHNCEGKEIDILAPATHPEEWTHQASQVFPGMTSWYTPFTLEFPMNNPVSTTTYSGEYWEGMVSAQGTITVSAVWN